MTDTSTADTAKPGAATELNVSPPPPPFYDGFQDADTKAWAAQGGFKSAEEIAQRARKFDAFKDADPANLVVLPAADAKPEAHMEVLRRLGAPEDAAAYKLSEIEGVDKDLAGAAGEWFKDAGITPWQAQLIASKQMAHVKAQEEALVKADKAEAERELAGLKTEWGGEYDAKRAIATRGFKAAGVSKETIDYLESGMGCAAVIKLGAFIGQFIKEGDFVDGEGGQQQPNDMASRWYRNSPANSGG